MDVTEFNNILNDLLKKINQEQKTVFLLGDFNYDLMHCNEHKPTNEFLDSRASNSYLPYIIQPSQDTSHSKTVIDNIFSNVISKDIISGNITATTYHNSKSLQIHLLIHLLANPMFLKGTGQILTRKTLCWTTLI